MTLSSLTTKTSFSGDGSTVDFATGFVFWNSSDLRAILVSSSGGETIYTEGSEYSVTGGLGASGTVSVSSSVVPETGETFIVKSNVALLQGTDLPTGGQFNSDDVESELDRTVRRIQQQAEQFDRTPQLSEASTYTDVTVPDPSSGRLLRWSTDANLENASENSSGYLSIPIGIASGGTGATTASSARDALGLEIGSDIQAFVVSSSNTQLATLAALTHSSSNPKAIVSDGSSWTARSIGSSGHGLLSDGSSLVSTGLLKQGKHTIWVPATAMRPTVSNGCAALTDVETTSGRPDMPVLDFSSTVAEFAQFSVAMPNNWDLGGLTYRAMWTVSSTSGLTAPIAIGLQGVAVSDDDTLDVAYGTANLVIDTAIAIEDLHITPESSALVVGGTPASGDLCFFRAQRASSDSSDTMAPDMRLIGVKLFYNSTAADDT